MTENISIHALVDDVVALAKKSARGAPPKINLSKETEALLLSVGKLADVSPKMANEPCQPMINEDRTVSHAQIPDTSPETISQASSTLEEQGEAQPRNIERNGLHDEGDLDEATELTHIAEEVALCNKCPLGAQRKCPVPGEGNPHASLVFVGEAPGAEEDRSGRPFVGRAGNLLTDIIVKGMLINREDVFICNVLKCRPPDNRTPNPEEVVQCEPYLLRQLAAIRPKVICALGATAAQTLLKTKEPIKQLRGVWHNYHGIPFRVTYHPAYLLRNPADKRKTWEDIQEIMKLLRGEISLEL